MCGTTRRAPGEAVLALFRRRKELADFSAALTVDACQRRRPCPVATSSASIEDSWNTRSPPISRAPAADVTLLAGCDPTDGPIPG